MSVALGLVGAGRWGARYISTIEEVDDAHLAVVASRNPGTRGRVGSDCEVTDDWRRVVESGAVDGLILATPPELHHEMAMACVRCRLPVLVEKPFTLDSLSALEVHDAALEGGALVMVDHTHLFSSAFEQLKERTKRLAPPLRIRSVGGNWGPFRADVDALWDYGPHDVAMCLELTGESATDLEACVSPASGGTDEGLVVRARLRFPSGTTAELEFGNGLPSKRRFFEVQGANGGLVYDDLAEHRLMELGDSGATPVPVSPTPPLTRAVVAFRDAIAGGRREDGSLGVGVAVVETLERIARAAERAP